MGDPLEELLGGPTLLMRETRSSDDHPLWETSNRIDVYDSNDELVATIRERPQQTVGEVAAASFMASQRSLELEVTVRGGRRALWIRRPAFLLFSCLEIYTAGGSPLGQVKSLWGVFRRRYLLFNESGSRVGRIQGPLFRYFTFPVLDVAGASGAVIKKRWPGTSREFRTDYDDIEINFADPAWTTQMRSLVLGAAVSIAFDIFTSTAAGQHSWGRVESARD